MTSCNSQTKVCYGIFAFVDPKIQMTRIQIVTNSSLHVPEKEIRWVRVRNMIARKFLEPLPPTKNPLKNYSSTS